MMGLGSRIEAIQLLLFAFVGLLILLAPLACWSLLSRILKVQQAMLNELRLLNAMIRNRGQRHEPSPPQATASSSRAHAPPGSH